MSPKRHGRDIGAKRGSGYHGSMKDEQNYRTKINAELDEKALADLISLLSLYDDRREYVD